MKSKQQNPPKNSGRSAPEGAAGDPNAGDPEDLRAMWSAVAALLDDTTVGSGHVSTVPAGAPALGTSPVAPSPATNLPVGNAPVSGSPVNNAPVAPVPVSATQVPPAQVAAQGAPAVTTESGPPSPIPASTATVAPTPKPVAPARWNPLVGSRAAQQPVNSPPVAPQPAPVTSPVSEQPSYGAPNPDAPIPDAPHEETPRTRNGDSLVPPYAPGAGPQILPAPDGFLNTPPPTPEKQSPALPRLPGEPFILPEGLDTQSVSIRGRNDGVGIQIGDGAWRDLLYMLSYRIEQTDGFFRGNHIAVDTGGRHLNEADLNHMRVVMRSFGLDPSLVRTSSERTFQAALALGIPVSQVAVDGSPVNEAVPAQSDAEGLGFFVYRGSLRSGQVLYRREHVIVIGDVNPGAEVVSDGDIMVWGRLRGIAHAGARGNQNAVITALDLDPVQLRIDQVIGAAQAGISSNGPRWGASRSAERKAELARLVEGKLTIQQWDEAKTGGVALLKRKFF